jgi:chromosome segregation ATPase
MVDDLALPLAESSPIFGALENTMEHQNENDVFDAEVQPKAEVIALVRYTVTPEDIVKTTAEYAALSADTTPGYEAVRRAIAYCRTTCVDIENQRKAKKAGALDYGRKVDAGAKALVALIDPIRDELQAKKDKVDQEKERVKREAEAAEKAALEAKIRAEREAEEARLTAEREAKEAAARAEREAEEARLAQQRALLEAQAAELAEQKRQQEEAARLEGLRIAAERQRLADEQAAAQKKLDDAKAAEDARQAAAKTAEEKRQAEAKAAEEAREAEARRAREEAAAAERARLAAERSELERQQRELAEAKAKAEREEADRLAKIQAEKDAAAQAERDRIAAEEARVAEAERQAELARRLEALKPDATKLHAFAQQLLAVSPPDVTSDEARQTLANAISILHGVVASLESFGVADGEFAEVAPAAE